MHRPFHYGQDLGHSAWPWMGHHPGCIRIYIPFPHHKACLWSCFLLFKSLEKCKKNAYKSIVLPFPPKAHDKSVNGLVKLWVLNIFIYIWLVVMVSVINLGGLEAHQSQYGMTSKIYIIKYSFCNVLSLIIFNII